MIVETEAGSPLPEGEALAIALDPFGFTPSHISRIIGLGGEEPGPDASYVFHTPYVDCGTGPVLFTVAFEGLEAKQGTLIVRIHDYSGDPTMPATLVSITQVNLRELAAVPGPIAFRIVAAPGMLYAALGQLYDETDARATTLRVSVDRRGDGSPHAERLAIARRSIFGTNTARAVAHLISDAKPTLAKPVSQMCTASQFDEPAYAEWIGRMNQPRLVHRKQWEFVYVLQALRCYGMLQPGARGLGFGVGTEPLPALMASMGCSVVATDLPAEDARAADWSATNQHVDGVEALRRPDLCAEDVFNSLVSFRPVDMTDISADLVGFDYTWSSCAYEHLGSIAAGLQFVEDSLRCLKPGGVAVHTTELNLTSNTETIADGPTVLFRKRDFERLALTLISRGHEVAQIKFDAGDLPLDNHIDVPPYTSDVHLKLALSKYVTTSFGMIVRRSLS